MTGPAGLAIGYHGCDKQIGEAAIAGTHPACSTNDYDWLGHGLYFWENDPVRAQEWASRQAGVSEPFVLGAVIDLGNCLDLVEMEHLCLLQEAYANLRATFKAARMLSKMPTNRKGFKGDRDLVRRNLDCAVINNLHALHADQNRPAFDTVRSPFSEGKPVYAGSGIKAKTHIQICVREPKHSIIGFFRVLK